MKTTLYTSFIDAALAEKAMGALTDHGLEREDISGLFPAEYETKDIHEVGPTVKHGITTTTSADAASGAVTGAGVGLGVGTVAALASLFIPGFGLVTGGSALVTALAAMAGTTAAGAVAGGVAGFFQDQGVDSRIAIDSEEALKNGQAVLIVRAPSGPLDEVQISTILSKYQGFSFARQDSDGAIRELGPDAVVVSEESAATVVATDGTPGKTVVIDEPSRFVSANIPSASPIF